ncbi:MAG: hypothetical protein GY856_02415 [bacterium]|nr:hypothetical protein [bacterium]
MMAMDIPLSAACGVVFAEAGKNLIKSQDPDKIMFARLVALLFAATITASNVFYYMLGWPAWETNFLWAWVDGIMDNPLRAGFSHGLIAMTVIPAWIGFEIGRSLILKGKDRAARILYAVLFGLVGLIVVVLWRITFNVASTYAKYQAWDMYSFWRPDFLTGWAITTVYFWVCLFCVYFWLRKKT